MQKKKILFIVNHDWFFTSHRLPIALECINKGFQVHLGSNFSESKEIYTKNGIKTHQLNISRTSINPFKSFMEFISVFNLLIKIKPDIVHLISHKPMIYGCLASIFLRHIKIVSSVSGLGYVFSDKKISSLILKNILIVLYKLSFYRRNLNIIFQNLNDRNFFEKNLNLKEKQITLIPGSGVKISDFDIKPFPEGQPIILFAGRLIKSKGILEFVKVSNLIKNARFVILGKIDPESKDSISINQIKQWTKNYNVEYWGFSKNIKDAIYKSTIVILPSYYGEGLPKILIEAAVCGRPVITTYNPGCIAAIENFKTGLAVPAKDYFSLSSAISFLLENPLIIHQMGSRGRKRAEEIYNIETVINSHLHIYKTL